MRIILASKSRARREMLANAGVGFETVPAGIDESGLKSSGTDPEILAGDIARAKASSVSERYPQTLVIGSDQVLEFGGEIFSKPSDRAEALERLSAMRGRDHRLVSAVSLCSGGREKWNCVDTATMTMADFSPDFLERYADAAGNGLLDTVGGYEVEGPGIRLFDKIGGDFFTVLGMPLLPLLKALRENYGVRF